MRGRLWLLTAFVLHLGRGLLVAGTTFQYISPVPGSVMVMPKTNVILRAGEPVDPGSLTDHALVEVRGSASGIHDGNLHLSDDGRTILFTPRVPFQPSETVTVVIHAGMRLVSGTGMDGESFRFTISNGAPPPRKRSLAEIIGVTPADFGSGLNVTASGEKASSLPEGVQSPPGFPTITVLSSDSPSPGDLFLSNLVFNPQVPNSPQVMIVDNNGNFVFGSPRPGFCLDFKEQPSGLVSYYDVAVGYFLVMDSTYNIVGSWACGNGYPTNEHELQLLPNGHALLLGSDDEVVRMDTVVAGGQPGATVEGIIIQELDRDGEVVFQWRSWDHFKITDATYEDLTATFVDYVHSNSLCLDTDGNIILSSRHLDEITKINRETGDIMWRWGGKNNQFTFLNDPYGFSHQHDARRLPNGDITLFDDGNFHTPPFSRAVEYALDETNKTARLVWQYRHSPDVYGQAMGNVQRLANGNTVIGWGATNPTMTEVRPDGSVAMEITLPPNLFSYRVFRFPWSGPSVGLTAEAAPVYTVNLMQNFPNPFNPSTTIEFNVPVAAHTNIKVYDLLGQLVSTLIDADEPPGFRSVVFDGSGLASGVYIYRMESSPLESGHGGAYVETKRLLLVK